MAKRETAPEALLRWRKLRLLQEEYAEFDPFLVDMMAQLGFRTSEIQLDIGWYMQHGPDVQMVQAQRGQAKTTIAAIFAVWSLIHDPKLRILIVSAGETQANEISTLIVRLIMHTDILEPLRPDKTMGDRTSVEHFDVHYSLKGIDKSPSVACVGVTGNLQGKRADLLIPDDIEGLKNSMTAVQRQQLDLITKEFSSISVDIKDEDGEVLNPGKIIWLGTPQTIDSIYNGLPGRGVAVRIWPGRVPTEEQEQHYGDHLAPIIKKMIASGAARTGYGLDGKQGAAVDSLLRDEATLLKKEMDQGPSGFQLQYMLLTAMTDALRHPLKTAKIVVVPTPSLILPMSVIPGFGKVQKVTVHGQTYSFAEAHEVSRETAKIPHRTLYIDPAGGGINGDETAWAHGGNLNSSLWVLDWGGQPGGHTDDKLKALADLIIKLKPDLVKVEKNFGYGLFMTALRPVVTNAIDEHNRKGRDQVPYPGWEEDMVHGQKEVRIIDTLEPIIGRGSMIFSQDILDAEAQSVAGHEPRLRNTYSGFFQLAKLTRDRQSLIHDDRIDALAGLANHYGPQLVVDHIKAVNASQKREYARIMANPLNKPAHALTASRPMNPAQKRIRKL